MDFWKVNLAFFSFFYAMVKAKRRPEVEVGESSHVIINFHEKANRILLFVRNRQKYGRW